MNHIDFNALVENIIIKELKDLLLSKGKEYSGLNDRFENFKKGAAIDDETPERTLWGYVKKHIVSISTYLKRLDDGYSPSIEEWRAKIRDIIVYMILLEGLLTERSENEEGDDNEEHH